MKKFKRLLDIGIIVVGFGGCSIAKIVAASDINERKSEIPDIKEIIDSTVFWKINLSQAHLRADLLRSQFAIVDGRFNPYCNAPISKR